MAKLLSEESTEFIMLDLEDKLLCLHVLENNNPRLWLPAVVDHLVDNYRHKGVKINGEELLKDLFDFLKRAKQFDNETPNQDN